TTIASGSRAFRVVLTPLQPLAPGDYIVRIGTRSTDATQPTHETLQITVPPSPRASGAIWMRRGPSTANCDMPTADLRFRRSELARVETATLSTDPGTARLLDRTGRVLPIPVTSAVRSDADGSRWLTGQIGLTPLSPGDYIIELSEDHNRFLTAFRVVP